MKDKSHQTMRAVAIDEFGGIEKMKPRKLPVPEVATDEVLVRVETAGVGAWDPFEREGGFAKEYGMQANFPHVLGSDGAGTVEEVGDQVRNLKHGDRVYGINLMNPKGGFYAEYTAVKANNAALIPQALSTREAGVLAVDGVTALSGLDKTLQLKAGESILILGASGGVGHLAVQLAKRMKARVLAVASGPDGVTFVKGLGADKVIDGHREDILKAAHEFAPRSSGCRFVDGWRESGGAPPTWRRWRGYDRPQRAKLRKASRAGCRRPARRPPRRNRRGARRGAEDRQFGRASRMQRSISS